MSGVGNGVGKKVDLLLMQYPSYTLFSNANSRPTNSTEIKHGNSEALHGMRRQ